MKEQRSKFWETEGLEFGSWNESDRLEGAGKVEEERERKRKSRSEWEMLGMVSMWITEDFLFVFSKTNWGKKTCLSKNG